VISFGLVWLRAAGLIGQALVFGGAVFALLVLRSGRGQAITDALDRPRVLIVAGALLAALAQAVTLVLLIVSFADDSGWPVGAVLESTVGIVGLVRVLVALVAAWVAWTRRSGGGSIVHDALLLGTSALLPITGALVGHATDRLDGGVRLMVLAALHQVAAGAWVGGLVCAAALATRTDLDPAGAWLRPFSRLAASAVAVIALTGIALSFAYVGTAAGAVGTSYGSMVLTKVTLFGSLLVLGVLNHRAVHGGLTLGGWSWPRPAARAGDDPTTGAALWRRRVEVEAGLALVTVFFAASISSAPPATDVGVQPVTVAEIRSGLTPRWPRFEAPSLAELAAAAGLGDPEAPRTVEDITWSEFGHNVSGVFVVAMGVLAMLERTGHAPWARHWPLLIIGLSGFVAWSLDPEGWQTGVVGFWAQLWSPEVLQHRFMLALTALLGVAEWRVRSGRHPQSPARYVFPVVCLLAGVLLLTHVHEVGNSRSAFLMELSHLALGLVLLVAGWSRWLELRLATVGSGRRSGLWWGPALTVFGLLLIFYREG
jgi:putative copper resistance protein D